MKIDEPDTPFEYQMKPVSDSDSDEDDGSASSGGGPSPPPAAFVLDGDAFAAAFEAKRHVRSITIGRAQLSRLNYHMQSVISDRFLTYCLR